jgi:hypothetical protein
MVRPLGTWVVYNLDKRSKSLLQRDLVQDLIPGSRFEMKSESLPTVKVW